MNTLLTFFEGCGIGIVLLALIVGVPTGIILFVTNIKKIGLVMWGGLCTTGDYFWTCLPFTRRRGRAS